MRKRTKFQALLPGLAISIAGAGACSHGGFVSTPAGNDAGAQPSFTVTSRSTRFVVREHMVAGFEMQLSGEPFATSMGRQIGGYHRDWLPPDVYFDPSPQSTGPWTDLAGFSSAIESYEYSKQPMNNLSFESGAGVALAYGPVLNPSGVGGAAACAALRAHVQHLGGASNGTSRFVHADASSTNPLGWPGIWPSFEPFVSFDPTVAAVSSVAESCSITSDDDPGATGALMSDDYECDATSLHLVDRANQVDSAISPGSGGWAGWKAALWLLNYLQVMHDSNETAIKGVPEDQLALVGTPGNTVLSNDPGGSPAPVRGAFLGSSDIEGFQAGMMLTGLDNAAQDWLSARMTSDGTTLGGFPDLKAALAYDASAPLEWFPAEIAVTETADPDCFLPRPTGYSIRSADSHLLDLAGLLGTYSSLFALTDQANLSVGGSQACRAYFDGDPFPMDDQTADGEPTLHDRALAVVRVALVNLERMHVDPQSGIPIEDVRVTAGVPVRGTTLGATTAAYTLLALRTTRRSLSDLLTLYTNTTPDTATVTTPIDAPLVVSGTQPQAASDVLNASISSLSNLFYDHLTDATGRAWNGWDVSAGAPTDQADSLDAHTAAVRALLVAFLASGNVKYRQRAQAVFQRVESVFWDSAIRIYRTTADDRSNEITYTPVRFALVQAMLRDTYELIGEKNGESALGALVLERIGRLNKLVLNGWDDRNGNKLVDWPEECVLVQGGLPRGGLQMAERTLTGETGSTVDVFDSGPRIAATDRDHDCVPEVSAAGLPAALADAITFQILSANR